MPVTKAENTRGGQLGSLLRGWRSARGRSQLDLAVAAEVSQRHLSFIESGRSTPGRETLMGIAEALDVPLRGRNALLLAAGYAPLYSETGWDEPQMRMVVAAVERMLRQQEPYPAVLMDRYWNVLAANEATAIFFGRFIDVAAQTGPRNILHLLFDPARMRPFVHDWDRVAAALIGRVRREAIGRVVDDRTRALLDALAAYPGVPPAAAPVVTAAAELPMVPLGFVKNGTVLNYFSMVTTVGTPATVAAQELRVECLFPADGRTENEHRTLMA